MTLLTSLNYPVLGLLRLMSPGSSPRRRAHVPQPVRHRIAARRWRNLRRAVAFTLALAGNASIRRDARARGCVLVTVDVVRIGAAGRARIADTAPGRIAGRITLSSEFPMGCGMRGPTSIFLAGMRSRLPKSIPSAAHRRSGQDDASVTHGTDADLAGLRVQPGDPLQRIAWKPSHAAPDGTRNSSRAATAEEASTSPGLFALRFPPRKIARLTAWVLAAERSELFALHARASRSQRARTITDGRADGIGPHAGAERMSSPVPGTADEPGQPVLQEQRCSRRRHDDTLSIGQTRWLGVLMRYPALMLAFVPP
jgi:hypothetical protein